MTSPDPLLDTAGLVVFVLLLTAAAVLLGRYLARLFFRDRPPSIVGRLEAPVYRLLGIDPSTEETWDGYARDLLLVPAAIPFMFGEAVGDRRQGYVLYGVMLALFLGAFAALYAASPPASIVRRTLRLRHQCR